MDFKLATKKAATKRIKQAVAEPIMARESAQSTRKLGVNGSERKSRACAESHDSRQDDVFHDVAGRA